MQVAGARWTAAGYGVECGIFGKEDALAEQLRGIAERILRGTIY